MGSDPTAAVISSPILHRMDPVILLRQNALGDIYGFGLNDHVELPTAFARFRIRADKVVAGI
jgi:hypothetical protein